MKNKFYFILILAILSLNFVSSVTVDIKDNFKKGENIIIKVSGNFVQPLTKDNIDFVRQYGTTEMGQIRLMQIEKDYYIYFQIPLEKLSGNYSVILSDIQYILGNEIKKEDIITNFTILNSTVPFSISPALIVAHNEYGIELTNLMPESIQINLEKTTETTDNTDESTDSGGFLDALFGLFSESPEENDSENESVPPEDKKDITLSSGETKNLKYITSAKKGFEVLNFYYNNTAYGVLVYNPEDRIEEAVENDSDIIVENETEYNRTIKFTKNETNKTNINITLNESKNDLNFSTKSCVAMKGSVCTPEKEKCKGDLVDSMSGKCCIGECEEVSDNSNRKIIGWVIILIIALFATWFFKNKYKRLGSKKINLLKIAKGKD